MVVHVDLGPQCTLWISARYEVLTKRDYSGDIDVIENSSLKKDPDLFDKVFCRRCLVFDCELHGRSQSLIFPGTEIGRDVVPSLKYTPKSSGSHSKRKRKSGDDTESSSRQHYNPCGCQDTCGRECPCLVKGGCCEKYCGCSKDCRFRFRGCHCAKSQCRSRQCPCFAGERECDPDVCRNCWMSCGDGSLGSPSPKGHNSHCRNMNIRLKKRQRVLLGKSDVHGWGVFLKNDVAKDEFIGEYTGELITNREADRREEFYERIGRSYLFGLNDQYCIDAYHTGNKLKFANHSSNPNCYVKVLKVSGDHRVGIFAKRPIHAGEELLYNYGSYLPGMKGPASAEKAEESGSKKAGASGSKKGDVGRSRGRPKRVAT